MVAKGAGSNAGARGDALGELVFSYQVASPLVSLNNQAGDMRSSLNLGFKVFLKLLEVILRLDGLTQSLHSFFLAEALQACPPTKWCVEGGLCGSAGGERPQMAWGKAVRLWDQMTCQSTFTVVALDGGIHRAGDPSGNKAPTLMLGGLERGDLWWLRRPPGWRKPSMSLHVRISPGGVAGEGRCCSIFLSRVAVLAKERESREHAEITHLCRATDVYATPAELHEIQVWSSLIQRKRDRQDPLDISDESELEHDKGTHADISQERAFVAPGAQDAKPKEPKPAPTMEDEKAGPKNNDPKGESEPKPKEGPDAAPKKRSAGGAAKLQSEEWYNHVMEANPNLEDFKEEKDVQKHIAELEKTFKLSVEVAL
ncbi:TOP2 [Symbiodinium sp. CCMP2592]|nr:TOP2 [Symbiodinium sp. CCMP2592]